MSVAVRLSADGRVRVVGSVLLPWSSDRVWREMRFWRYFATLDPFHKKIEHAGDTQAADRKLRIHHRFGPVALVRHGRLLRFEEAVEAGRGFAFSDLSARDRGAGFPHVYDYRLRPAGPERSRVSVTVTGRWTALWLPRPIVRAWLAWVMRAAMVRIGLHMLGAQRRWPSRVSR